MLLEWKKLRKNKVFWALLVAYLVFLPSSIILSKKVGIKLPLGDPDSFYTFPMIWKILGYNGNWFVFMMIGFLIVFWMTSEYRYKTFRQNTITGLTRQQYFLSKLLFVLKLCGIVTVYFALCGWVLGSYYSGQWELTNLTKGSWQFGRFFLMSLGYSSIAFFIGTLIRNSGLAVIVYISYGLIIENMIRYLIHIRIIQNTSVHYYPVNAMEDLMPIPFAEFADSFMKEQGFEFFLSYEQAAVTSSVFIVLLLFLTYQRITRANI
jgi:hypothetical protein